MKSSALVGMPADFGTGFVVVRFLYYLNKLVSVLTAVGSLLESSRIRQSACTEWGEWTRRERLVDADLYFTKLKMAYSLDASQGEASSNPRQQPTDSVSSDRILARLDAMSNEFSDRLTDMREEVAKVRNELAVFRYQTHQEDVRRHNRECGEGVTGMCFEIMCNSGGVSPEETDPVSRRHLLCCRLWMSPALSDSVFLQPLPLLRSIVVVNNLSRDQLWEYLDFYDLALTAKVTEGRKRLLQHLGVNGSFGPVSGPGLPF